MLVYLPPPILTNCPEIGEISLTGAKQKYGIQGEGTVRKWLLKKMAALLVCFSRILKSLNSSHRPAKRLQHMENKNELIC